MKFDFLSPEAWPVFNFTLFYVDGRVVTIWNFIILIIILWLISLSTSPFRQITSIILFLLVLTILGFFSFPGLSIILLVAVVLGLIFRAVGGQRD